MRMKKGMTIIELLVVISITSLILSAGFSSLAFSEQRLLKQAAAELRGELKAMQRLSLSEGRYYSLLFAEDLCSYKVSYSDPVSMKVVTLKSLSFPKGVILKICNAANNRISYTPSATLSGNACSIILASENYSIALTANLGAGNISIKDLKSSTYTLEELENNY